MFSQDPLGHLPWKALLPGRPGPGLWGDEEMGVDRLPFVGPLCLWSPEETVLRSHLNPEGGG